METQIKNVLKELIVDGKTIPVKHIFYKGKETTYVTWTIIDEDLGLSANDTDLYSIVAIDIDVFSKGNYLKIEKEIKKRFKTMGWIWSGDSTEMYEPDTKLYHKTITFKKEKELDNG